MTHSPNSNHFVSCFSAYFSSGKKKRHISRTKNNKIELNIIMSDSSSSATSYIHMVQHLIEECMLFNMTRDECMDALAKHANILPVITSTVWKELEKENKQFFEAYSMNTEEIRSLVKEKSAVTDYELETMKRRIHKMLSDLKYSTANGSTC